MFKNVATKIALFAFDTTTGAPKTGDAANLTAYVSKDYGTVTVLADTSATEMDSTNAKGWYLFDVAQAESNADALLFTGKSTTSNVSVVGQYVHTTPNRFTTLVIDAAGLVDANAVKVGPTGSGTAQTARDIGASVLLSSGTGAGQLDFTSGVVKANATQWLGGTIPAVTVTGVPLVDLKYVLGTISPAAAGSVRADAVTGAVGSVTGAVGSVTGAVGSVTARVTANTDQLAGQTVTAAAGVTFPASVASPTNITAGTITTVTNLTNAPTNGDLTTAMKASVNAEADTAISDAALATAANLATVAGYLDTEIAEILAVTNKLDDTLEDDGGTFRFTANSLEEAPTGGSAPTAVEIADEVETRAMTLTAGERTATADALLNRDMSAVSDTNSRSPLNALRFVRNKWTTAAGSLSVKKEDDTTEAWSATLTTDAGAEPLTGIDPA